MEIQSHQDNIPPATEPPKGTIFTDIVDTKPYEKSLRNARICLYTVAALQIGVGIYHYSNSVPEYALLNGGIPIGLGILFLAFAFWSYKKPVTAFLTALITFVAAHVLTMMEDPSTVLKGIILKVVVVVLLIKAVRDAKEYEKLKESIGEQ